MLTLKEKKLCFSDDRKTIKKIIIEDIKNIDIKYINNMYIICNEKILKYYFKMYNIDNVYIDKNNIKDISILLSILKNRYYNNNYNSKYLVDIEYQLKEYELKYNFNNTITFYNLPLIILILLHITKQYILYGKKYLNITRY